MSQRKIQSEARPTHVAKLSLSRATTFVTCLLLVSSAIGPAVARASIVGVQTNAGMKSSTLFVEEIGNINDPGGPNYKASSNLSTGEFKAFAGIDSSNNNLTGFPFARANFTEQITYVGAAPITIAFGTIQLEVEVDFSRSLGTGGGVRNTAFGLLQITKPDTTKSLATVKDSYLVLNPSTVIDDPPETFASGGAGVTIIRSDSTGLHAFLNMPSFTLNPGDAYTVNGMLEALAVANGINNVAITDGFNTATLSWVLPQGVDKGDFIFGEPGSYDPAWVSSGGLVVPEPATLAIWTLLSTGAFGSHLLRRRRRI